MARFAVACDGNSNQIVCLHVIHDALLWMIFVFLQLMNSYAFCVKIHHCPKDANPCLC